MSWIFTIIAYLIAIALLLGLVAAVIAPFESLGWWAGWSKRWPKPMELPPPTQPRPGPEPSCYIVYLSGVGSTGAGGLTPKERNFLTLLAQRQPGAAIIDDVFPYSPAGVGLTEKRATTAFWRWVTQAMRRPATRELWRIIGTRNVLQVAVSADPRYGPVFNFGIARSIVLQLLRQGYQMRTRAPIILVGLSGGGQVAVGGGAALRRLIGAPVWVISVGGVLTSDASVVDIEHIYHLSGSRDHTQYLGLRLYPGCWPIFPRSAWNQAMAQGKRTVIRVGPMRHMGHGDYFSPTVKLPDGQTHAAHSADVIGELVDRIIVRAGATREKEQGAIC